MEKVRDDEYLKIDAVESDPVHRNFHAFLTGRMNQVREQLLPEQYRHIFRQLTKDNSTGMAQELKKIEDPYSRLIATGVCLGQGRINEDLLSTGIETASRYGWKKALLVYLDKLRNYYQDHHQQDKAATVAQRMQLITQ